jgi:aspartokinase/homoserine dehydrogenase 1
MLVMKFGGTSVADAERILHAADLVRQEPRPVVVVTSALGGVTDELEALGADAAAGRTDEITRRLAALRDRHEATADGIAAAGTPRDALRATIDDHLDELDRLLQGVGLVQEISPRSRDLLVSFGERLAAPILATALRGVEVDAEPVDAREIITADHEGGQVVVDMETSRRRARDRLLPLVDRVVPVVTGFVAATSAGSTTTLGRGGSDYSATLVGSFVDAESVWIWTDVDGVMTADPRMVPEARVLDAITYREAAEMAYFGSRVLHPSTMIPAVDGGIPVRIRNTFRPDHPGTRITGAPSASALGVKVVTSVPDLALVTVEGNGMIGVPGMVRRVFAATASAGVNVYMISQASSEHNISFVVHRDDGPDVVRGLERELEPEMTRHQIDRVDTRAPVGIVAVIGEGMKGTPGISQRLFTALGVGRINVLAIAQGSSELNLSVVVADEDLPRSVGAVHSRFGLTRDTHLVVLGKGLVGKALLEQVVDVRARLADAHGIGLSVMGVCGSEEMLLAGAGLDDDVLRRITAGAPLAELGGAARPDDAELFRRVAEQRWLDVVVVDLTAAEHGPLHEAALRHGFHVVTANKKPMSGPLAQYRAILAAAADHGVGYHFETTFGAGLPALASLQDLIATGDVVHRVTGCFSGTLGYLCTELERGRRLSEAVAEAARLGYTEPDPRDDLGGMDVARKALIIARQLGGRLEPADIDVQGMTTPELAAVADPATFMDRLPEMDEAMAARVESARAEGKVLRFVATITCAGDDVAVEVGLRAVDAGDAIGQLSGPDNILVFETERYNDHPLVIRGPGAGAEVTAAGVLGDILKIVRAS